jgi:hypothetical protein
LAGLLLGCWFRVPALIAASAMAALISMAAATHAGAQFLPAVGWTFALLGTLQVGYLAGLMLSCAGARARYLLNDRFMLAGHQGPGHSRDCLGSSREP